MGLLEVANIHNIQHTQIFFHLVQLTEEETLEEEVSEKEREAFQMCVWVLALATCAGGYGGQHWANAREAGTNRKGEQAVQLLCKLSTHTLWVHSI